MKIKSLFTCSIVSLTGLAIIIGVPLSLTSCSDQNRLHTDSTVLPNPNVKVQITSNIEEASTPYSNKVVILTATASYQETTNSQYNFGYQWYYRLKNSKSYLVFDPQWIKNYTPIESGDGKTLKINLNKYPFSVLEKYDFICAAYLIDNPKIYNTSFPYTILEPTSNKIDSGSSDHVPNANKPVEPPSSNPVPPKTEKPKPQESKPSHSGNNSIGSNNTNNHEKPSINSEPDKPNKNPTSESNSANSNHNNHSEDKTPSQKPVSPPKNENTNQPNQIKPDSKPTVPVKPLPAPQPQPVAPKKTIIHIDYSQWNNKKFIIDDPSLEKQCMQELNQSFVSISLSKTSPLFIDIAKQLAPDNYQSAIHDMSITNVVPYYNEPHVYNIHVLVHSNSWQNYWFSGEQNPGSPPFYMAAMFNLIVEFTQ